MERVDAFEGVLQRARDRLLGRKPVLGSGPQAAFGPEELVRAWHTR